jgi:predicted nucleic acid-binding protein
MAAQAGLLSPGLLDTSIFIAAEAGRPLGALPPERAVSVITVAELQLGVLMAGDPGIRAVRLHTLASLEATYRPLPVDRAIAGLYAELNAEARRQGHRPGIMDALIAATAVAHGLPVYTQDARFTQIPRVQVVLV